MDEMVDADSSPQRERAYGIFTENLMSQKIVAGQFVSQRELVEIIGLPLAAIRALVPRLEAEGLITSIPQRGLQVRQIDIQLIRNAFQFRLMLEREAIIPFVNEAPDEVIAQLRRDHEAVLSAAENGVTPELVRQAQLTDWQLHDTIIDWLGNEIVSNAYRTNSIKIRLIRQANVRIVASRVPYVMRKHLGIIELMEKRDAEGARALLTEHIMSAKSSALEV